MDVLIGGEQQRAGIARALTQQPRLILADEPVSSLDPASAHRVLSLLRLGLPDRRRQKAPALVVEVAGMTKFQWVKAWAGRSCM